MKILIVLSFIFVSNTIFGNSTEKIRQLEERVRLLEEKASGGGLKVKDLKDKSMNSSNTTSESQITEEQKRKLMKEIDSYKKSREEGEKLLREMEAEGL